MNTRILNREGKLPDDGWYQIESIGEHVNHRARVIQVIDEKSITAIVNRFAREARDAGPDFPGQRIDKDHLSGSEENPTESLGWAMELRNRNNVPEARIDWTALGLPLIESKPKQPAVYKFFSTEYEPADCEKIGERIVNRKTYAVVRPLRLAGLSLTNDPNNKGQRPISNRSGKSAGAAETQPEQKMKNLMKLLGLAEDASEESAVAAVQVITNRATQAEASVTTLTTERDALLKDQVEADLEKYKNRFKPENRETVRKQLIANRKATIELFEAIEAPTTTERSTTITNRRTATAPAAGADTTVDDKAAQAAEVRAAKITNRASQLRASNKNLTLAQSYEQAEREITAE